MDIVALYAQMQEGTFMNKKLGRLIHPGMGTYFMVMICFCLAALLMNQIRENHSRPHLISTGRP